jgi:tetratricopeptide (TPR) repeat protein
LDKLTSNDCELESLSLIRLAVVERHAGRLRDSLSYLQQASEIAELTGPWVTARYHQELGSTLKDLALSESNRDYFNQALEHYGEALNQFEAVGNHRYAAVVHNNHGFMLLSFGDLERAKDHLQVARLLFDCFSDLVKRAQADESLARLKLAIGEVELAEETISQAIEILENGDEDALLAEALTTKGEILFSQGRQSEAKAALESAYRVAERCGDKEGAGRALLLVIERMGDELGRAEQKEILKRAEMLLAHSQQTLTRERLKRCLEKLD